MSADEGADAEPADAVPPVAARLEPVLGFGALVAIGLGATLGVFVLKWSSLTGRLISGPGWDVHFAYAVAGLVALCTALAFADLAGRYPSAGGAFTYAHRSLGPFLGNLVGWCLFLNSPSSPALRRETGPKQFSRRGLNRR